MTVVGGDELLGVPHGVAGAADQAGRLDIERLEPSERAGKATRRGIDGRVNDDLDVVLPPDGKVFLEHGDWIEVAGWTERVVEHLDGAVVSRMASARAATGSGNARTILASARPTGLPASLAGEIGMLLFALGRSRAQFAWKCGGLDAAGVHQSSAYTTSDGESPNLRRILVDLHDAYARHVGHADLLREAVDGLAGEDPPQPPGSGIDQE